MTTWSNAGVYLKLRWKPASHPPFLSFLRSLCHMWRMVTHALDETQDPSSKRAISFIRIFSIVSGGDMPPGPPGTGTRAQPDVERAQSRLQSR